MARRIHLRHDPSGQARLKSAISVSRDVTAADISSNIGESVAQWTPEMFEARDRAERERFLGSESSIFTGGPGRYERLQGALRRTSLSIPSKPWGPYRAIQLDPIAALDAMDPRWSGVVGPAPNQAQEWFARRQVSIIRMRDVLSRFSVDSFEWRGGITGYGVLNEEMDREGITRMEQDALRAMPSAAAAIFFIDSMSMTSPFLSSRIVELQRARDRALTELASVVGRGTHDPGSGNWAGAVNFHFENGGLTAEERDLLLAGNLGAFAMLNPISPFALLWGKAIVEPISVDALNNNDWGGCQCPTRQYFTQIVSPRPLSDFVNIMLTTDTGARVAAEDNDLRVRFGLAGRGTRYLNESTSTYVTAPENEFYRWPRDVSEVDLSAVTGSVAEPFFKYQWAVFKNNPRANIASQEKANAFILPDRELIVALACPTAGPTPRTTADWKKTDVQVFLRARSGQMAPGPMVPHYCDLSVARWWFEIALALATDNRIIARLDTVSPDTGLFPEQARDGGWNPIGWYAQTHYVRAIAEAIANGYNALNVPWYIDPVARALYRDWFAGHDQDEYDLRRNYNDGNWFTNREQCDERRYSVLRARISPDSWTIMSVGEMPARLARIWKASKDAGDRRTLEFLQKAGVMLWAGAADRDPYLSPEAFNRGFASGFAMGWDVIFASPLGLDREPTAEERTLYRNATKKGLDAVGQDMQWDLSDSKPTLPSSLFADDWYASIVHAPPLQDRNNICDWRAGGFDPGGVGGGTHIQGTVPLRWYVAWLREWAMACTTIDPLSPRPAAEMPTVNPGRRWTGFGSAGVPRRTVGNILRDAKSYATDINLTWAAEFGGQAGFTEALVMRAREFGAAQPNAAIRMTGMVVGQLAGSAASIGAAAGGSPQLAQTAGALATTTVTAITDILSVAIPNYDCTGYGRDDLGRPKPSLERASLSGNAVANEAPTLTLAVPYGFCRSEEMMPEPVPTLSSRRLDLQTERQGSGTLAMAAVGVGLVAAAVWLARRPKAT